MTTRQSKGSCTTDADCGLKSKNIGRVKERVKGRTTRFRFGLSVVSLWEKVVLNRTTFFFLTAHVRRFLCAFTSLHGAGN